MKKLKKADYIIIFVLVIIVGLIVFVNILGNDTDENQGTVTENIATKIDLGECEDKLKENISSSLLQVVIQIMIYICYLSK